MTTLDTRPADTTDVNVAKRIVDDVLGGTRAAARLLERPSSTVQSWKKRGFIPADDQDDVLSKAKAAGKELTEAHFFAQFWRDLDAGIHRAAAE